MKVANELFVFERETHTIKPGSDWPGAVEAAREHLRVNYRKFRDLGAAIAGASSIQNIPLDGWNFASDDFVTAAVPPLESFERKDLEEGFVSIQSLVANAKGVRI